MMANRNSSKRPDLDTEGIGKYVAVEEMREVDREREMTGTVIGGGCERESGIK